jgi:hypothetical protein
VNGQAAHRPVIYDMKAGSFLALRVIRSILRQKVRTRRPGVGKRHRAQAGGLRNTLAATDESLDHLVPTVRLPAAGLSFGNAEGCGGE